MRRANQADLPAMIDFIRPDVANCLYIYINLRVYGTEYPHMPVWVEETDGQIRMVALCYYDTALRIYCRPEDDHAFARARELVETVGHRLVFTTYSMAQRLAEAFPGRYRLEKGMIMREEKYRKFDFSLVEQAKPEDAAEIAALICGDPFYSGQYQQEKLAAELAERMRAGTGRSFIIRQDGRIVVHSAITAEVDDIAMVSLFICHKDYRNRFLGETVENYIIYTLQKEGKVLHGLMLEERRIQMLERMHNSKVALQGKLTLLMPPGEEQQA